jgi:hypothetical protein
MELYGDEWVRKGATLSDKTARAEFGLTQDEIIAAIRAGKLQYRPAAMQGTRGCGCSAERSRNWPAPGMVSDTSGNSRRGPS